MIRFKRKRKKRINSDEYYDIISNKVIINDYSDDYVSKKRLKENATCPKCGHYELEQEISITDGEYDTYFCEECGCKWQIKC